MSEETPPKLPPPDSVSTPDESGGAPPSGDSRVEVFIDLYTKHEVRLRAFALSLIPRWSDAAEVFQQSSLILWRNFESFEIGTSFFSWASKIVYRQAKDFRKSAARRNAHFSDEILETIASRTSELAESLDERQWALDQCLAKLKPEQRQMLRLRYEEDGSVETVAQAMGRTADAVYKALARIRKSLSDCVNRALKVQSPA